MDVKADVVTGGRWRGEFWGEGRWREALSCVGRSATTRSKNDENVENDENFAKSGVVVSPRRVALGGGAMLLSFELCRTIALRLSLVGNEGHQVNVHCLDLAVTSVAAVQSEVTTHEPPLTSHHSHLT